MTLFVASPPLYCFQIVIATYIGGVASALTATSYASALPTGVSDVIAGRISAARVGLNGGSASAAWWMSHVSQVFTPFASTRVGIALLASGQLDGVYSGAALMTYTINQGYCSCMVTEEQVGRGGRGELARSSRMYCIL